MLLTKRTNVLLDESDYATLLIYRQKEGKTLGELIRDAVRKVYKAPKKKLTVNEMALNKIAKITTGLDFSGIDYKELISDGRKY